METLRARNSWDTVVAEASDSAPGSPSSQTLIAFQNGQRELKYVAAPSRLESRHEAAMYVSVNSLALDVLRPFMNLSTDCPRSDKSGRLDDGASAFISTPKASRVLSLAASMSRKIQPDADEEDLERPLTESKWFRGIWQRQHPRPFQERAVAAARSPARALWEIWEDDRDLRRFEGAHIVQFILRRRASITRTKPWTDSGRLDHQELRRTMSGLRDRQMTAGTQAPENHGPEFPCSIFLTPVDQISAAHVPAGIWYVPRRTSPLQPHIASTLVEQFLDDPATQPENDDQRLLAGTDFAEPECELDRREINEAPVYNRSG